MDTRFDAVHPRAPVAAPAPAPRPAEAPWARAWAHEWQQASGTTDNPAAAGAGNVRVAWRDASAASTWLAPVRAREDQGTGKDRPASQSASPDASGPATAEPAATHGKKGTAPHDAPASLQFLFVPAAQQVALPHPAAWTGDGPAPQGDAEAAPPLAPASSRGAAPEPAPAAAVPPASPRPAAPGRAPVAAAPRTAPPSRVGEARPFAPTNLLVTAGEDGPAVWLRDARLSPDGQAAARVLQALATLGWPHTLRPGALFLNGRPLAPNTPATRALPPQGPPDTLPSPKEDPHGH